MGISAVDKLINIEEVTLSPTFKTGDKNTVNLNASGNIFVINHAFAGTVSPNNPDLIAEKTQELLSSNNPEGNNNAHYPHLELTLGPFIGIVKSPNLKGTQIHVEFVATNTDDKPNVISGCYLKLSNGLVHFKKFFQINQNGSREPDLTTRFPIIINSRGATRLSVEVENLDQQLIEKGTLKGGIFVLSRGEQVASKDFIFEVNQAMVNTLAYLQGLAENNKAPLIFDAMIKS